MSAPILATKLHIPAPRPTAVHRPQLVERLNAGLHRKLTLISAPAGFGKTTLIGEWVTHCERRAAWLSLEAGDSDPLNFLNYLVAALRTAAAGFGENVLAVLHSSQPLSAEAILPFLLNEVAALPDEIIFVLDDYHAVESAGVNGILSFMLEHLPPQLHIVIASRKDPDLPLARLRARDQLTELRVADLRFAPDEAAAFLHSVMGLELTAGDIADLETRTEGWITGLQLAAISMQGDAEPASFIRSFTGSNRYVLDYLVEEVLNRQPETVQVFLLRTSILDRLCSSLCDAVAQTAALAGEEILLYLERANLFVLPLDDKRQWYRYHHLFADVLQARLIKEQPVLVAALHRRASAWYEANGLRPEAIRHALSARDFERAANLIELSWTEMEASFQVGLWLRWAKMLPEDVVRTRPVLCVDYAYALLDAADIDSAMSRLDAAETLLEAADPSNPDAAMVVADERQFQSITASISIARAFHAQAIGDLPAAVAYASRVLELTPEATPIRRGQASALLGLTYWSTGSLEAANRSFADYTMNLRAAGNIADAISTTFVLADIRMALGRLAEAENTLQQLLRFVLERGDPVPVGTAELYRGISDLYRERGDLDSAAQYLLKGEALSGRGVLLGWKHRLHLSKARLKVAEGDLDGALDDLEQAERAFTRIPLPDVRPLSAYKARIWTVQGRLAEAFAWMAERGLSDDDLSYLREFEHLTAARILLAHYRQTGAEESIDRAARLLSRLAESAAAGGRTGSLLEVLMLQALVYEAKGETTAALTSLDETLALAEPEGYIRLFVDEGQPMQRLLNEAAARRISLDYTRRLLASFTPEEPDDLRATLLAAGVDPLSEREREVLQYIAAGHTNQEIAEQLYLSLFTVKAHARTIFSKLNVKNRTQAVARARELGILPRE